MILFAIEYFIFDPIRNGIITTIPEWMNGESIQINIVRNLGSYRKLLPLIEAIGDDDLVITADDDVLYSEEWLSCMVEEAGNYPESVVCGASLMSLTVINTVASLLVAPSSSLTVYVSESEPK